jgi:DNA-binding transcriptional LysR family regulator
LDALASAVIGVPGKARGRSGLMPARTINAAWRAERGCWRVRSVVTKKVNATETANGNIHAVLVRLTSGQLPFLGLRQNLLRLGLACRFRERYFDALRRSKKAVKSNITFSNLEIMDSLDLIYTFREVARRNSFSAAARALDMSPANVSKYVVALEARFGVRLFNRTTRKVSLTDAGQLLYDRSGPMLELIQLTEGELHERATKPSGRLTISAPNRLMQTPVPMLLGRFLEQHPAVSLKLLLTNRVVDLADEGVDIALRVGPIPDASVIVRRFMQVPRSVAATPGYWRAHGIPAHPRELAAHRTLSVSLYDEAPVWYFRDGDKPLAVPLQPLVDATEADPLLPLALQGLGVLYAATSSLAPYLENGALVEVLAGYVPQNIWLHAAYAQRRHNSAAMAALLNFLQQETLNWPPRTGPVHAAGNEQKIKRNYE